MHYRSARPRSNTATAILSFNTIMHDILYNDTIEYIMHSLIERMYNISQDVIISVMHIYVRKLYAKRSSLLTLAGDGSCFHW